MFVTRLFAFAGLPVFNFAVAYYVSGEYRAETCGDGICWPLAVIAANGLLTWAAIYFGLFLLAIAAVRMPWFVLRAPLYALLAGLVMILLLQCLLSWYMGITGGMLPSADMVVFVISNAARIPQHLLQTAPAMTLGVVFFTLMFSLGLAAMIVGPAGRVKLPAASILVFWIAAALGTYFTAPHAEAKFSALAFNKMLLVKVDPRFDDYKMDASLEKTFVKRSPPAVPGKIGGNHPVIVILVESLRRDLIEMEPTPIPFLRSLAEGGGIFFDKAYATASHSNYADVAFWYSRYPMRSLGLQLYLPEADYRGTSLFKLMKQYGYATGYISSQNELWGDMINWLRVPGEVDYFYHSENFDGETWLNKDDEKGIIKLIREGVATAGKIEDSRTLDIATRWIDSLKNQDRFFLGMNLQNTHFTYVIPPGGVTPYQPSEIESGALYYFWPKALKQVVRNRYLNAVHNLDRLLAAFAARLKARNLWDNALVVIVGDSGEAFHEHGVGNHSGAMYDEVMRTFVLIKPPKNSPVQRGIHKATVSHLDITATIPRILGIPVPASFQGHPVFQRDKTKAVFMHTNAIVQQNGMVRWPWKILKSSYPFKQVELYNLEQDPGETRNLAITEAAKTRRLSEELDLWVNRHLLYYSAPKYYNVYNPPT